MRILWAKANRILPAHSGGDLRSLHLLRQLRRREEVIFFSYYSGKHDAQYERALEHALPGAVSVCMGKKNSGWARGLDYLRKVRNPEPYAVGRFAAGNVRQRLRECVAEESPDVVICDFLDAAINLPERMNVPCVLFQHNVESEIWRRHAENARGARRLVYRHEFARMLNYERAAVRRFDHVIAVSDHDRKLMSAWTSAERISVVPTGVDTDEFRPTSDVEKPLVVFVGAMDWEPNVDAAVHFCEEIWPRVAEKCPDAKFRIVGRNPDARVRALANRSVEVTGRVESVVEHLHEAAVVVVPLRVGGGTRIKIYEAMAAGKTVVSTSVGAEGLDVHDGRDIVLANSSEMFSDAVVRLLKSPEERARLGGTAARVAERYSWDAAGKKFAEILLDLVSGNSSHASPAERPAEVSR